jgi:CrcB protein
VKWLLLMAGGGLGAALRFALAGWVDQRVSPDLPWGTLAVNLVGCFAIGLLVTWADARGTLTPGLRLFLIAGLLGGFTTFSTFGLETWQLLADGRAAWAMANAAGSVIAGMTAVVAGVVLGRALA